MRWWTAGAAVVLAGAVFAARPGLGCGVLAVVAALLAVPAAVWPSSTTPAVLLGVVVVEAGLAERHGSPAAQALLGVVVAYALWSLHVAFALLATCLGAAPPRQLRRQLLLPQAVVATAALPGVVVVALLAWLSSPGPAVRALGLVAAAAVCALPVLLARRP